MHEQTPLGDVFLRSLLKEQLALAIRVLVLVGPDPRPAADRCSTSGPSSRTSSWPGCPSPGCVLGGLVYPFLLLVGWRYVRSVERNEGDFADLVEGPPQ